MEDLAHAIWTLRNDIRERMASRTSMAAVASGRLGASPVRAMDVRMIRSCTAGIRALRKAHAEEAAELQAEADAQLAEDLLEYENLRIEGLRGLPEARNLVAKMDAEQILGCPPHDFEITKGSTTDATCKRCYRSVRLRHG